MPDNGSLKPANPAHTGHPTRASSRYGLTASQITLLLFLSFILLIILAVGLGFVTLQEGLWALLPDTSTFTLPEEPFMVATVAVYQLPSTWTPTLPQNVLTPTPVATHPPGASPIPPNPAISITPSFGQWRIVIGRSVQNRPIEVLRFGAGKKERMIVAGIHGGNEWNTIALADELIELMILNPQVLPTDVTLYILRSLNPDGEAVGNSPYGRANANGVDLNRNFGVNWKSEWRTKGCWSVLPLTAGPSPGSEPETQALVNFLLSRRVEVLVSYHSAGLGVFPSGDPLDPASVRLAEAIAQVSGYGYPPAETGCEYTGTLPDWAGQHGITAVDLELPDHFKTDFAENLRVLTLLLNW